MWLLAVLLAIALLETWMAGASYGAGMRQGIHPPLIRVGPGWGCVTVPCVVLRGVDVGLC